MNINKLQNTSQNRICILRSNPVEPDSRVEKEADALVEAGYSVDIFCWNRESNHIIIKDSIHNNSIARYRKGCKSSYGGGMKNIIPYLRFQISMFFWLLHNSNTYSCIHACDFDTALFSYLPAKIRKTKIVFDIFDFICGNPRNIAQNFVKKLQLRLIDHCDATIICTEQRKGQILGSAPRKLIVIHNSPDARMRIKKPMIDVDKEKLSVVYVGVLLDNRLLKEMTNYFIKNDKINFYVGGFGMLENYFKKVSSEHENIKFIGKTNYEETLFLESHCDIMTAIYDPAVENHQYAASNKFYESLMLGKPIIMARGTGLSNIVEKYNIGELIDYSEDGFSSGMEKLIARRKEWNEIGEKMKRLYKENYNWDIMSARLISLYNELLNK